MKLWCKFFGHRVESKDSGYGICDRCGTHEYYDWETDWAGSGLIWYYLHKLAELWKILRNKIFQRCPDCGKPEVIFGRFLGDHKDCDNLPF